MGIMDKMMGFMVGRMSREEKEKMIGKMMDKFFGDMTVEEKKKMVAEMMPKMMEGINMMEMMPKMMTEMMPQCLKMMLPNIHKEKRIDFVLKMVTTLMEQGCFGMSEEEKKDFVAKVFEKVKT